MSKADSTEIVLLDPFTIEPEPFNGRGLAVFDPNRNLELIDDMRQRGNTVPVRVRPKSDGVWTCASGSRRVNAAKILASEEPEFRVRAIIDNQMTDAEAFALCLSDNHGRSEVTPMQRGREIQWAIAHLYDGSRKTYLDNHPTDPSVVSRALELVNLPEKILACAIDRESLPTVFAEKIAPKLKHPSERKTILSRAEAIGEKRFPAAQLSRYLLTGSRKPPQSDRRVIKFGSGRRTVFASAVVHPDASTTLKIPSPDCLTVEEKAALAEFIAPCLAALTG